MTEKISSLAMHARDARYWSPEQMLENFLRDLRAGKIKDVSRACLIYASEDEVAYYSAGTQNLLEILGLLSMASTAVAVLPPKDPV